MNMNVTCRFILVVALLLASQYVFAGAPVDTDSPIQGVTVQNMVPKFITQFVTWASIVLCVGASLGVVQKFAVVFGKWTDEKADLPKVITTGIVGMFVIAAAITIAILAIRFGTFA